MQGIQGLDTVPGKLFSDFHYSLIFGYVYFRIHSPFADLLPTLLKRALAILVIQYIRPYQLIRTRQNIFLYLQLCLRFPSHPELRLIVEWPVEATVIQIDFHDAICP